MSHVIGKPPKFDGTSNVRGYFRAFESWCWALEIDPVDMPLLLTMAMVGEAKSIIWDMPNTSSLTYIELKDEIIRQFGGRET